MFKNNADTIVNWDIVNFSLLCGSEDLKLLFDANLIQNTDWEFSLRQNKIQGENYVSCALKRTNAFPEITEVDFEIALMAEDGSILKKKTREGINFFPNSTSFNTLMKEDDLLVARKAEFLPRDILRTRLKMWSRSIETLSSLEMSAISYAEVETNSFVWHIDNYSKVETNQTVNHKCELSFLGGEIIFNLSLSEDERENLKVDINYEIEGKRTLLLRFHIIDSNGNEFNCGMKKMCFSSMNHDYSYVLPLSRQNLRENKDLYLANDILSLRCQYTACIETPSTITTKVELDASSKLVNPLSRTHSDLDSQQHHFEFQDDLRKDLSALYQERILCDIKLQTETETFPTHSVILSARSPVFRTMLTGGFEEEVQRRVKITDFDADTVSRMLKYMYMGYVEDLCWESALKLYMAADKYTILSLKRKCSLFLKENANVNNVCDVLCFAALFRDKDLVKFLQVYIIGHANVVMKTNDWKKLMKINPTLAAETMYMNWEKD